MNRIILAYHHLNAELAERLDHDLARIGIPFERITDDPDGTPGAFSARLLENTEPVILLVTENFLKSREILTGILPAAEKMIRDNQFLVVVADGKVPAEDGSGYRYVPTHFDRMVYALQYMNYWQNAWLDLSSQQQEAGSAEAKAALEPELDATRRVANDVGELISMLKEAGFVSWEELLHQDYALFFRRFGLQDWHDQYRRLSAYEAPPLPVDDQAPVVEMPLVTGPLAPMSVETPEVKVPQPARSDAGYFSGMDALLDEMAEEEPFKIPADEPADLPVTETPPAAEAPADEPAPAYSDAEIRQAIRDAWLWLEKGHTEQGMALFQLALDQHPDNDFIRSEYEAAQAKYNPEPQAETTVEDNNLPEPADEPYLPDDQSAEPAEPANQEADEAKSYDLMGDMAAEKGDYLFAKYCWDRAAEIDPQYPGIFRKLGVMTSAHLRNDYKETAVHYLQKALEQDPRDAEIQVWLADAALQNGDPAQAEQWYRSAIDLDKAWQTPDNDRLYLSEQPPVVAEPAPEEAPAVVAEPAPAPDPERPEAPIVLITGATSGIGRATAEIFARHGYRLILTGRRVDRLSAMRGEFIEQYNNDALMLPFDVRDQQLVRHTLETLPENWQNIDILINNAGLAKGLAPIHEGDPDQWETMIDTNIKGLLYVTRAVAPGMVKRRKGHIINVGSAAGKEVYPNGNVYCATKFAVDALSRAMRYDLHTHNIRVSQVSPGHVEETEFALTRFDGDTERANIFTDFQPLKASDVAETIYFMATRPVHVNIQDVYMFGTQQAGTGLIDRSGR